MELSPGRALELLAAGDREQCVGLIEDERVECKAAPYRLDEERERLELAKDVSALANAQGGLIIVGLRTGRDENRRIDIVRGVSAFDQARFDIGQYARIVADWVYPPPQIRLTWFASQAEQGRGVAVIEVAPQADRPYVVSRLLTDQGRRVEVVIGYFERQQASAEPVTVHRLHSLLRDGMRFDEHLRAIAEAPQQRHSITAPVPARPPAPTMDERIAEAITVAELGDRPTLVLAARLLQGVEIPGLVEALDAPVVQLIQNPPSVRRGGFNVFAGRKARLVRGELRRASGLGHRCLDVWRDGAIIFIAEGDGDFLCWSTPQNQLRINPVPLYEIVYLFVELSKRVVEHAVPRPNPIEFSLDLRNALLPRPLVMVPYHLGAIGAEHEWNQHPGPAASKRTVRLADVARDSREVAFLLIRELYFWFGFTLDDMPYLTDLPEGPRGIDPQGFVTPGR